MSLLLRRRSSGSIESGGAPPAPTDPFFSNVELLLGFNGSNGATSTTDDSNAARTITFAGAAALSTSQIKFGSASLSCPDTSNAAGPDYVQTASDTGFNFGSGDWTAECWFYMPSFNAGIGNALIMRWGATAATQDFIFFVTGGQKISCVGYFAGAARTVTGTTTVSTGAWHHAAVTRNGTAFRVWLDGNREATFTLGAGDAARYTAATPLQVGRYGATFVDECRVTKGVARYSATTYTVPTAAFPRS